MNEQISSKNNENDEHSMNAEEKDYKNLISKLKEISATITSIEKKYLDKF
jgi:hypothetical protein